MFLSPDKFDVPWIEITATGDGTEGPPAASVPPGGGPVNIDGQAADATEIEGGAILRRSDATNRQAKHSVGAAIPTRPPLSPDAQKSPMPGSTSVSCPPGASLAEPAINEAFNRFASYQFINTDGREVEVTLTAGGARDLGM